MLTDTQDPNSMQMPILKKNGQKDRQKNSQPYTAALDIHPSLLKRKIIHFDMDSFYAAVEIRDNPNLQGKPIIIGGSPSSRSVVCTASYEARKFGIHSAMSCAHAKRLCPEALFITPNFSKYREASSQILAVFQQYTPLIEPLSLDEAYLDVTHNHHNLYAVKVARLIQNEIIRTTALTGSAGIAANKLIAKIASDYNKPKGLTLVLPENVLSFMQPLPLRKIPGIGPVTETRLKNKGFTTCGDIWPFTLEQLQDMLGHRMGAWIYDRSRGIDHREVQTNRTRKSIGEETTFSTDLLSLSELGTHILKLSESLSKKLRVKKTVARTVTLKVKYADFKQITRSLSITEATDDTTQIATISKQLLKKTEAGRQKIRLLGLSLSNLNPKA